MTAHRQPHRALWVLSSVIVSQGSTTLVVAALKPFVSTVLNVMEVTCGVMDTATLILTAVAYRRRIELTGEALVAQPDHTIKVTCQPGHKHLIILRAVTSSPTAPPLLPPATAVAGQGMLAPT